MPLQAGNSREVISRNISEMVRAGHPQRQAVAAALRTADQTARKGYAFGGSDSMYPPPMSYGARGAERELARPVMVDSDIPGRTDRIPTDVPAGAYVVPADVVSGLGEGNTMAGANVVQRMMATGPHGVPLPEFHSRSTIPRPPRPATDRLAKGGGAGVADAKAKGLIPIVVAGGEIILAPEIVAGHPLLGGGNPNDPDEKRYQKALKIGHRALDAWVVKMRKTHIATLKKLPGPKK